LSQGVLSYTPRATAISETRVGSNGRFFAIFRPISRRISETVQDTTKVTNLLLNTDRKPHKRFRLVPKSTTLDDLELTFSGHYVLFYVIYLSFGAHHEK